jgi:hypothetical protein
MPVPAPNDQLLRSLNRLVRGLSALFWGMPATLIVCCYTARADTLKPLGIVPGIVCTAWLVYGLWQLGDFQKQERVWRAALDRSLILGLINLGLSPFLYWYGRFPTVVLFMVMTQLFVFSGLMFLGSLNLMLQRLGAMLPDEALRHEIRQFTALNLNLLLATLLLALCYLLFIQFQPSSPFWQKLLVNLDHGNWWLVPLVPLVLLPLAMTMALIWKTKEVILDSVFSAKS